MPGSDGRAKCYNVCTVYVTRMAAGHLIKIEVAKLKEYNCA